MKNQFSKIIDISWPISHEMTSYKDNKPATLTMFKNFPQDSARDSNFTINSHTGTHVDAPSHFLQDGPSIENFTLNQFIGPCQVIDLTDKIDCITAQDLEAATIETGSIILFKTKNSFKKTTDAFEINFIYLEKMGAQYLADKKIKAVGIDYLGIERNQSDYKTHKTLLQQNIPIIEGLRLEAVAAGNYFFVFLPLKIQGLEAAPGRAILIQN